MHYSPLANVHWGAGAPTNSGARWDMVGSWSEGSAPDIGLPPSCWVWILQRFFFGARTITGFSPKAFQVRLTV